MGDMAAAATVLSRIEYYLVEDEALDKGRARQMTESCMEAIRYYKGISETVEQSYFPEKPYYERTDTENDYDKALLPKRPGSSKRSCGGGPMVSESGRRV